MQSDQEETFAAEPKRKTKPRPSPTKRAAAERESPKAAAPKLAPKKAAIDKQESIPAEASGGGKDELKMKVGSCSTEEISK